MKVKIINSGTVLSLLCGVQTWTPSLEKIGGKWKALRKYDNTFLGLTRKEDIIGVQER